jgi:hypothetical protein
MKSQGALNVELLRGQIQVGWNITGCHFRIERDLLSPLSPTFEIHMRQNGSTEVFQFNWSSELAEYLLLENPHKMASHGEEIERLGYVIYSNIKSAEVNWGSLVSNAALVDVLLEKNQQYNYDIDVLISRISLSKNLNIGQVDANYRNCRSYFSSAIQGLQNTVVVMLHYGDGQETILLMKGALIRALDTAFHLSVRKMLFNP